MPMPDRLAVLAALLLATMTPAAAQDAKRLAHIVVQDCGSCHGLTMKGGLGRPLTREALANTETQSIAAIILDGIPGTAMPAWRPLISEDEALWMAEFLKKGRLP